jgi:hypothetical protein
MRSITVGPSVCLTWAGLLIVSASNGVPANANAISVNHESAASGAPATTDADAQQTPAPPTGLRITVQGIDTTPPVISLVTVSLVTSSGATIKWTTNEPSNSQVDYGLTTYGSSSALNASLVTSHTVSLSGLAQASAYHARVRSRDGAGNMALSGDLTFTTLDGTSGSGWSHEPGGLTMWAETSMNALTGNGWGIVNPNGYATVLSDVAAPLSPPGMGQWTYPSGFAGGQAPATMYHSLPSAFDEGFVGVWWKPSNPWQGHSTFVNKIYFLLGGACGNLIPIMYGPPGGPYQLRVAPEWGNWSWLTPNVNAIPIVLGSWHKIELYFKYNTPGTGIVRWWMDGTLLGDYTNISFPASGCFTEFQFSPTWGGVGGVKTETDYFWFDHAYVSHR